MLHFISEELINTRDSGNGTGTTYSSIGPLSATGLKGDSAVFRPPIARTLSCSNPNPVVYKAVQID
jgi:hypothetical protein